MTDLYDQDYGTAAFDIDAPVLSAKSGFYKEPFNLEIQVPEGTKVYYTLDCSTPTEDAILYTGPIYLDDATQHDNVYSMRTDVTAGFYTDMIALYKDTIEEPYGYQVPDYPVDKCNVVRAIAIAEDGSTSDEVIASYFVGINADDYDGCNIISLITDPKNLFDYETGIYVTGKEFDDFMAADDFSLEYWRWWYANYRATGKKWERPAQIQLFDSNGICTMSQQIGIRTQGNASKGIVPRSLHLIARKEYGEDLFQYNLFGNDYFPARTVLASGSSSFVTQFKDYAMGQFAKGLRFSTMDYQPYVLFLEGEYWGFYWITERYDGPYLAYHYGVNPDNVLIIKDGEVSVGSKDASVLYDRLLDFFASNDLSNDTVYRQACEIIDVGSFIDYYATQIYIARNEDFPLVNFALWRTMDVLEDPYSDGKWRWMLFDSNSECMTADLIEHDTLGYMIETDPIFGSIWHNHNFQEAFRERLLAIAQERFDTADVLQFIDQYVENMFPIMSKSMDRFFGKGAYDAFYYDEMADYRAFFSARKEVVESWLDW